MAAPAEGGNSGRELRTLRHIRNSLAISSLGRHQFLLRFWSLSIARLGDGRLYPALTPGKVYFIRLRLHRWSRLQQAAGVSDFRKSRRSMCGGGYMATALVDL